MIHQWGMEIYWRLPIVFQEAALNAYAGRLEKLYYGEEYERSLGRLDLWKSWSAGEAQVWQTLQLRSLVKVAATRVPYYRDRWRNVDWKFIRSLGDLHILPTVEKQSLRQQEHSFIVDSVKRTSLCVQKTSGSTGTSLRIFWPKAGLQKFWATMERRVRNVAGVGQHVPRAMMGGRPIVRGATSRPPYWRFNRRWHQLYLSSYHVSTSTVEGYVRALRHYGSQWITGYGSAIAALAEVALQRGISPLPLKAAIVSGDTLLPEMRNSIEKFFQCKCFDQYGQAEGAAMAMECSYGKMHVVPEVGIIEILGRDGTPCRRGEVGEVVATGLLNDAMPLIRYYLGDCAAWAEDQSCRCGNPHAVMNSLEGRVDDYLVTSDGRKIGRLSTAVKRSPTIHSAQIVQDRPGHAYLLVRGGEGYRSSNAIAVRDDILGRIGSFGLEVIQVSEIPKTPAGKTLLVVRLDERPEMREIYDKLILDIAPSGVMTLEDSYPSAGL